jgi:hypothetical protein
MATKRWLAVAFAAVLAVAACSGDDSDASDSGGSDDATSAADLGELPGEEELEPGLLTVQDVPMGWAEVPDDGDEPDDPLCGIRISRLLGLDVDELPRAEVQFAEDVDTGPSIGEQVGFVPEGRGADALRLLQEAVADCEGDDFNGLDVTVSELSFPPVGDESAAYRVHFEDPDSGQSLDVDAVWARRGDLLVYLYAYDADGDSTGLLQTYAEPAVDKAFGALVGG